MPGFVRTKSDEARWSRAKEAAGKETAKDSKSYWKLSNYIYHKMGKSGQDLMMADLYKNDLITSNHRDLIKAADELIKTGFGGMLQMSAPKAPMKVGGTAVKTPKSAKLPDPFGKPSLFFKREEFEGIKHPSVENLRSFLEKNRTKK